MAVAQVAAVLAQRNCSEHKIKISKIAWANVPGLFFYEKRPAQSGRFCDYSFANNCGWLVMIAAAPAVAKRLYVSTSLTSV